MDYEEQKELDGKTDASRIRMPDGRLMTAEDQESRQEQTSFEHSSQTQDFGSVSSSHDHEADIPQSPATASFHTAFSASSPGPIQDVENEGRFGDELSVFGASDIGERSRGQENSAPPLSIITDSEANVPHQRRSEATSPISPVSPVQSSARSSFSRLPLSPRTRDRGFSLRRSILARNVHEKPEEIRNSKELQSLGQSTQPAKEVQSAWGGRKGRKQVTDFATSPNSELLVDSRDGPKPAIGSYGLSPLPHYEKLVASEASRSRLLSRFRVLKAGLEKKILRYQELPPSKDGRHVVLDPERKKPLIDERTGREYINNLIISCRYSLYNFLPRQLFAQFSKLANFYFLCVSILQLIPGLSTTGTYTTIVPLLFFVTISMAKEGYDDFRRYKLDKEENKRSATVMQAYESTTTSAVGATDPTISVHNPDLSKTWANIKWQNIRVGDVVKLARDDAVPADIVVLQTLGTEGVAYVETMALDGETNLKSKQAPPIIAREYHSLNEIVGANAQFVVEDPNLNLYNLEGKAVLGDEILPLNNDQIIYRGSTIRNTRQVIGVVIYTGEECKIRMNATKNPRIKAPALQAMVNKVVVILVVFVVALAIFNTVAYQIWQEQVEEDSWYLNDAGVAFFPNMVSFIIIFNTLIPLSLYVSLEIVKVFQMFFLNDIEMYDETSNTPMEARTSTINEELGQVSHIFSDKTGTLTNNLMRFRKMSVAGTAWFHHSGPHEEGVKETNQGPRIHSKYSKGKKPAWRRTSTSSARKESTEPRSPIYRNGSSTSDPRSHIRPKLPQPEPSTMELIRHVQRHPQSPFTRKVRFFILSVALCHTCFPEKTSGGEIEYQAASPDEQALVKAAQDLGYVVVDRQNSTITIKSFSSDDDGGFISEIYEVLDVLEFSSNRKRMSIIVRMPNNRICVFSKGADSTLIRLLRSADLAMSKSAEIEQKANKRKSLEAQEAIRRESEARSRKNSMTRRSISIHRPSLGGVVRSSMTSKRLQAIPDDVNSWLSEREADMDMSPSDTKSVPYSPGPSTPYGSNQPRSSMDIVTSFQGDERPELMGEARVIDEAMVFEKTFQHINDFATEGLRTLLYGYRYIEEGEYKDWKKIYLDASTSLVNRQEMIEQAAAMIEQHFELAGATAIEDKLQDGVPEAIDKLRRAKIKLWMLTGDKRETAINIGHSCRLIKDYSTITVLDHELGDVSQRIAAATLQMNNEIVAHSVVVIDGHTLSQVTASESLRKLFLSLIVLVDTVICCRASPAQKASLVSSIRRKVKNAITLAIGDGANDIAMIQEAHVGIGITGKEGMQAARTSDYSIAQFRFLTRLLLVHGRWNYIRTCKYTLGTFWKEMLFYLTQALFQRYAGYTGTSLYESWSLSMFNTLFTSLPVIFMGIFEQDLKASTLLAIPELYHSLGHHNEGFNLKKYLAWVAMASSQAVIVFFIMLGLYGHAIFTMDNGLFAMGDLTFTACVIVIATKLQFWELQNKTYTCAISMFLSIGGWFLWNIILSSTYHNNVIYNVKGGFFDRFGQNPLWWLTLILVVSSCWAFEVGVKTIKVALMPSDADVFRELERDPIIRRRFEEAAAIGLAPRARHSDFDDHVSGTGHQTTRTAAEDRQREGEVQDMLDRRRHSRVVSGTSHELELIETGTELRQRHASESEAISPREQRVSFANVEKNIDNEDDEFPDHDNGKGKPRRRSIEVNALLRKGFGSICGSLDHV